ncbi:unnamed protein product [Spirodela intermedia]|uniref:Uncharacterized protein n=1 Tax=Spirodela intermedia TaxID=51605 RepID=A0A7I8ILG5_SPIIN|nr:unnamed protein product [Spirodela intermedia]CAA6657781.1 unnamed protein product [Spirodela intermedia]
MREIVTLQVGGFANFIGSHFWNFQDELLGLADDAYGDPIYRSPSLDMDVLYRSGETQQGNLTYTPRLISIGFQGSLGSLSPSGSSSNEIPSSDPSDIITWVGGVSKRVSEPHKKNLFLQSLCEEQTTDNASASYGSKSGDESLIIEDKELTESLENDVNFWTDFSKVHYHHRTFYELHGSWGTVQEFDNYGIGKQLFSGSLQAEEISDRLRFFVEECDHIQGIQCIVDDSGGFSGVAADLLEHVADEYPNKPVLLYSARGPYSKATSKRESVKRALHDAVSLSMLSSFCRLMVPIGLPSLSSSQVSAFLRVDDSKPFHCSAVYAASMHSISLPFRMDPLGPASNSSGHVSGAVDIAELAHMLSGQTWQNRVAILDAAMPAPALNGELTSSPRVKSLHPLTPETAADVEDPQAVESLVVHGALSSGGQRASISEATSSICSGYDEGGSTRPRFFHISVALCPLPIPLPFPSIFGPLVDRHGGMAALHRRRPPLCAAALRRLPPARVQRGSAGARLLSEWGLAMDEAEDVGEALSKMATALNPHPDLSSDSD